MCNREQDSGSPTLSRLSYGTDKASSLVVIRFLLSQHRNICLSGADNDEVLTSVVDLYQLLADTKHLGRGSPHRIATLKTIFRFVDRQHPAPAGTDLPHHTGCESGLHDSTAPRRWFGDGGSQGNVAAVGGGGGYEQGRTEGSATGKGGRVNTEQEGGGEP